MKVLALKFYLFLFWLTALLASPIPAICDEIRNSVSLIELAERNQLAFDEQWLTLLHYHRNTFSCGYKSYADDPLFFLSPSGKYDPEKELEATIEAFHRTEPLEPWKMPARCIFVARYNWLKEKLAPISASLPDIPCPEFNEWYQGIAPESLTLVFASSYMNNPASAFGHTLLRFDQTGQDDKTRILSYTANYSADAVDFNALLYAIKGIFGGYSGYFAVAPYYEKVKLYSDIENRDLWEYQLSFSQKEVKLLVEHLWELRKMGFDYYYFDENCSFQLLSLLDVARPSLHLMEDPGVAAIPVDTIRKVIENQGLLKNVVFRPSAISRLRNRISYCSENVQKLAKKITERQIAISDNEVAQLAPQTKAQVFDLSYDYLDYKLQSLSERDPQQERFALEILKARSTTDVADSVLPPPIPATRPDQGHKGNKIDISYGFSDESSIMDFGFRPTFHTLNDPEAGYTPGSQINMLGAQGRLQAGRGVQLQNLTILDLTSITPRNRFLKPLSWNFHMLLEEDQIPDEKYDHTFKMGVGGGWAWELSENAWFWTLASPELKAGHWLAPDYAFGGGPRSGLLFSATDKFSALIEARFNRYLLGDVHNDARLSIAPTYSLSRNTALFVKASRDWNDSETHNTITAGLGYFF